MIKHIVHIDKNYPRKLNGAASNTTISKDNWGFNTEGSSLNGSVTKASTAALKSGDIAGNDYNIEGTFESDKLTQAQYNNLEGESNEIRFNANIFNYLVHTTLNDVLLKYDSPVFCGLAENWIPSIIVLDDRKYDYQIFFDIYLYDPVGIDAYTYEGYVRNALFTSVKRDNGNSPDVYEHDVAVYWDDPDTAHSTTLATAKTHKYHIYAGTKSSNGSSDMNMTAEQLPDKYDDTNYLFKRRISFSGRKYDTNYINSTDAQLEEWDRVTSSETSTEADILAAWKACDGIKYKFYDVAGNITYWVMPHLELTPVTLEDLAALQKLELTFINTHPADLQLGTDLIGRTTILVKNLNSIIYCYPVEIGLDNNSIGTLYPDTKTVKYVGAASYITEDVDNIVESGWVHAYAYVDIINFTGALEDIRNMVKNRLRATGSLGEWIKECSDNRRKLTLDPFVPQYLKEVSNRDSAYYKFVKFTEKYLNTMFKAYDKNCYISVLEVIDRINNFNDPYQIYSTLLERYDDDHGDMLHMDFDDVELIAKVLRGTNETT